MFEHVRYDLAVHRVVTRNVIGLFGLAWSITRYRVLLRPRPFAGTVGRVDTVCCYSCIQSRLPELHSM